MEILDTRDRDFSKKWQRLLEKVSEPSPKIKRDVAAIIRSVMVKGDQALLDYTKRFDHFSLTRKTIRVGKKEIRKALDEVGPGPLHLFERGARRIRRFHERQRPEGWEIRNGSGRMGFRWTPIRRVGLYVPGGGAAYPSTLLMNAIPAQIAGVPEIAVVTPAPNGRINPYLLAAAHVVGIDEIYRVGGAQGIAALACGTESIPAVDKIVGPGNAYVSEAKRALFGRVGIDMIAGPTEILILADSRADPSCVAADLLSQAEHDSDARCLLVTTSEKILSKTLIELKRQSAAMKRRELALKALGRNGMAIITGGRSEAVRLANEIAPEHLVLMMAKPRDLFNKIENAGAIFLGPFSPVALGDYSAGPNHVLPTARTARFTSPLGVYDFVKGSSWIEFGRKGLAQIAEDVMTFARIEGLTAHSSSVRIRL